MSKIYPRGIPLSLIVDGRSEGNQRICEKGTIIKEKTWGLHPFISTGEWELELPIIRPWLDNSDNYFKLIEKSLEPIQLLYLFSSLKKIRKELTLNKALS